MGDFFSDEIKNIVYLILGCGFAYGLIELYSLIVGAN